MNIPPGMIGIPCSDNLRTPDILPAIIGLQKPAGTVFKKETGLGTARPLNTIGRVFMSMPHLEWLFLTNDDNLCPQDTIPRLWAHNVDVVTGFYVSKRQPFKPIIFSDGIRINLDDKYGLIPIDYCGDGCMLIRRKIMERIVYPWWTYSGSEDCDHDLMFSQKVRKAGFKIYCDLDILVDHASSFVVRHFRN